MLEKNYNTLMITNTFTNNSNVNESMSGSMYNGTNLFSPSSNTMMKIKKQNMIDQDELLKFRSDYHKRVNRYEKEIKDLEVVFKNVEQKFNSLYKENNTTIAIFEKEIKDYKYSFDEISKDIRVYYLEILQKGIDVR
jgi:archaellum component FlaC